MIVYFIRKGGNIPSQGYLSPPYKEASNLNSFDDDIKEHEWKVDGVILDYDNEVENLQADCQGLARKNHKLTEEKEKLEVELSHLKESLSQLLYDYELKLGGKKNDYKI